MLSSSATYVSRADRSRELPLGDDRCTFSLVKRTSFEVSTSLEEKRSLKAFSCRCWIEANEKCKELLISFHASSANEFSQLAADMRHEKAMTFELDLSGNMKRV